MTIKEFDELLTTICENIIQNDSRKKWSVEHRKGSYDIEYQQGKKVFLYGVQVPEVNENQILDEDFYRIFCLNFAKKNLEHCARLRKVNEWAEETRKSASRRERRFINAQVTSYKAIVNDGMKFMQTLESNRTNGQLF